MIATLTWNGFPHAEKLRQSSAAFLRVEKLLFPAHRLRGFDGFDGL